MIDSDKTGVNHFKTNRKRYVRISINEFNDPNNLKAERLSICKRLMAENQTANKKKVLVAGLSFTPTIL
jgi:hypothetical protein